jgi:selenoprotein W-related protein
MAELIRAFEPHIELITLLPSDSGRFEVTVNDQLIYSKLQLDRHPEPGEIAGLLRKQFGLRR